MYLFGRLQASFDTVKLFKYMPLSSEQRRIMDIHVRSNTIYDWHGFGTESAAGRAYIIGSIEQALDSVNSFRQDLFLPNCFINGCENSNFWYRMAAIVSAKDGVEDWHELEYGAPLNIEDHRQRYVYTWTFKGDVYRFYTKTLSDGSYPELVWYVGKSTESTDGDIDSADDTDTDGIVLHI